MWTMELQLRSSGNRYGEALCSLYNGKSYSRSVKSLATNELNDLLQHLKGAPGHSVTLVRIFRFVTYAVLLKDDILLPQPS